jgi:hypothetical protein
MNTGETITIRVLGAVDTTITLDADSPTVGKAKTAIERISGMSVVSQELFRYIPEVGNQSVREEDGDEGDGDPLTDDESLADGDKLHVVVTPVELVHGRKFPIGTAVYIEPGFTDEDIVDEFGGFEDTQSDDSEYRDPKGDDQYVWDVHGHDGYPGAKYLIRSKWEIKNERLRHDGKPITRLSYAKHASLYTDIADLPGGPTLRGLTPESLVNGRTLRWWPLADPGTAWYRRFAGDPCYQEGHFNPSDVHSGHTRHDEEAEKYADY